MKFNIKNRINSEGSKGFTLFELLVVVSIMSVLVVIAGGSLSTVTNSRAMAASEKISAMLSQSKINALSGETNTFELYYDANEKCYVCSIANTVGGKVTTEKFGNDHLTVYITEYPNGKNPMTRHDLVKADGTSAGKLVVEFNKGSGSIKTCTFAGTNINGNIANAITAKSRGSYTFRLFKATGSQVNDY